MHWNWRGLLRQQLLPFPASVQDGDKAGTSSSGKEPYTLLKNQNTKKGDRCIYKIHGWYSTSFLRHTKCYNLSGPEIITKKTKPKTKTNPNNSKLAFRSSFIRREERNHTFKPQYPLKLLEHTSLKSPNESGACHSNVAAFGVQACCHKRGAFNGAVSLESSSGKHKAVGILSSLLSPVLWNSSVKRRKVALYKFMLDWGKHHRNHHLKRVCHLPVTVHSFVRSWGMQRILAVI